MRCSLVQKLEFWIFDMKSVMLAMQCINVSHFSVLCLEGSYSSIHPIPSAYSLTTTSFFGRSPGKCQTVTVKPSKPLPLLCQESPSSGRLPKPARLASCTSLLWGSPDPVCSCPWLHLHPPLQPAVPHSLLHPRSPHELGFRVSR